MQTEKAKKRILLHSCCGPCSTAVTERLAEDYDITVFYFNPNITDPAEYEHRKAEQIRYLAECPYKIDFIEGDYAPQSFFGLVRGHEEDREGGERCALCFEQRLEATASLAAERRFDCFDTTLTVSPYKSFNTIYPIGCRMAEKYGIEYVGGNYKKKDGYKRSIELSADYGLYRQHYCGCEFSRLSAEKAGALK